MGPLSWIIFGALAGWLASIIVGNNKRQGCLGNVIIGVVGALAAGFVMERILASPIDFGWDFRSFAVAVLGAVGLLLLLGKRRR